MLPNSLKTLITHSRPGRFLIRKCAESDAWAWGVAAAGIAAMVGVMLV